MKEQSIFNKFIPKNKYLRLFIVLLFLMVTTIVIISAPPNTTQYNTDMNTYATKISEKCSNERYRPGCYDNEIPKFLSSSEISMEDAIKIANIIQTKDHTYGYCHSLGHKLASIEVAKDPTQWKNIMRRCPVGTCANGCQHGVLQERFRAESLTDKQIESIKPDLQELCHLENRNGLPTNYEIANCYHGLGHMTVFMTKADLQKALGICDNISKKSDGRDYTNVCYDGLFMQVFQTVEPEDIALVKDIAPDKRSLFDFCNQYSTTLQKQTCWLQGWFYYKDELSKPLVLTEYCNNTLLTDQKKCYDTAFHGLAQITQFDDQKTVELCNTLSNKTAILCYVANISARFNAETTLIDNAVSLCNFTENQEVRDGCYEGIVVQTSFNFHSGTPEFNQACSSLPEEWKLKCLKNT